MLEQRRLTESEADEMWLLAMKKDNLQAAIEVKDHYKFFGKTVEIIGGKSGKKGTKGHVFYVNRIHFGKSPWLGYQTRVGIKTDGGDVVWTNADHLKVIEEGVGL